MQRIATRIFIYASIVFGVMGVTIVLTLVDNADSDSTAATILVKSFMITGLVVLSSFALSVAGKYLKEK